MNEADRSVEQASPMISNNQTHTHLHARPHRQEERARGIHPTIHPSIHPSIVPPTKERTSRQASLWRATRSSRIHLRQARRAVESSVVYSSESMSPQNASGN
jgi:hypothetical protein